MKSALNGGYVMKNEFLNDKGIVQPRGLKVTQPCRCKLGPSLGETPRNGNFNAWEKGGGES
jgi:hypothetical protein